MNTIETGKTCCEAASRQQTRAIQYMSPAVDIHQDASGFVLEVELPGVGKSGVELTVEDGKLIIVGHRNREENEAKSLHREISGWDYRRVFDLDPVIDPSSVQASMEHGLLRVHLQKAEAHQPRKIVVS